MGETALFWAVGSTNNDRMEVINLLLAHPAIDVNIQDNVRHVSLSAINFYYFFTRSAIFYRRETLL